MKFRNLKVFFHTHFMAILSSKCTGVLTFENVPVAWGRQRASTSDKDRLTMVPPAFELDSVCLFVCLSACLPRRRSQVLL